MQGMSSILTRRQVLALLSVAAGVRLSPIWSAELEAISPQPYFANVKRALDALAALGVPLLPECSTHFYTVAGGRKSICDALRQ